ncbi:MAG: hypothetical protein ACPGYV_12910 [Phycisphaeraceae bacterium]
MIWPFKKKPSDAGFKNPRYAENPIYRFAELYVLDTLGLMPAEKNPKELDLQAIFKTKSTHWREVIAEVLHFSNTIDVAIKDLWYRNKQYYEVPLHFAQDFIDKYNEEGSKVDVWPPGALEAAIKRIEAAEADQDPSP